MSAFEMRFFKKKRNYQYSENQESEKETSKNLLAVLIAKSSESALYKRNAAQTCANSSKAQILAQACAGISVSTIHNKNGKQITMTIPTSLQLA